MGMFGNGVATGMTPNLREVETLVLRPTSRECFAGVPGSRVLTSAGLRIEVALHQTFRAIVAASGLPQFASDPSP